MMATLYQTAEPPQEPASMSAEERTQAGIPDGLIRIAVGIESAADVIGDLEQALAGVA
jgi:cystathionine beta-lyase/cystathionine gamma-synthase